MFRIVSSTIMHVSYDCDLLNMLSKHWNAWTFRTVRPLSACASGILKPSNLNMFVFKFELVILSSLKPAETNSSMQKNKFLNAILVSCVFSFSSRIAISTRIRYPDEIRKSSKRTGLNKLVSRINVIKVTSNCCRSIRFDEHISSFSIHCKHVWMHWDWCMWSTALSVKFLVRTRRASDAVWRQGLLCCSHVLVMILNRIFIVSASTSSSHVHECWHSLFKSFIFWKIIIHITKRLLHNR